MQKAKAFFFSSLIIFFLLSGFILLAWKYDFSLKNLKSEIISSFSQSDSKFNTFDVEVKLGDSKTSKIISDGGGLLQLKGEKTIATLDFPKNSLLGSDAIIINSIESLRGLKEGWSLISGVQISPDGKKLAKSGELAIEIPANTPKEKLVGFSYNGEGQEFYLYPITIKGNRAILKLDSFSGYGLMTMEDPGNVPPEPSGMEKRTKQAIAQIILEAQRESGGLDTEQKTRIWNLLDLWFRLSVKPHLEAATQDETKIYATIHEFLSWQTIVNYYFPDEFSAQEKEAAQLGKKAIINAKERFSQKCLAQKDALQAGKLYWLYKLTLALPSEWGAAQSEPIKKELAKCARFEVKMTSATIYESCWTTDVSGDGYLGMDSNFNLLGNLSLKLNKHDFCGQPCYQTGPEVYDIELPAINFGLGDKNDLNLLLKFGASPAVDQICPPNGDKKVEVTLEGSAWDGWFADLHSNEIVWLNTSTDEGIFRIPDWEIINTNGIFAKKVYERTKRQTAGIKSVTEKTVIELIHKPIK